METILRAVAAYVFLLFTLRIIGRRSVAHMTPFELIVLFLVGGMTVQAIVTDNRSLTNAFLAVMAVALMNVLVAALKQRSRIFGKVADGTPIVVFDGHWLYDRMDQLHLQEQDVLAAARQQGLERLEQVRYALDRAQRHDLHRQAGGRVARDWSSKTPPRAVEQRRHATGFAQVRTFGENRRPPGHARHHPHHHPDPAA